MSDLQFPGEAGGYPESSGATTALALAIASIFMTFLAPFALWMAVKELRAIESGRRSPEGMGSAKTARILALITTILFGLSLLFILVYVGLLAGSF